MPVYSNGLKTQRDAWCYNSSAYKLKNNVRLMLDFYNEQAEAFQEEKRRNPAVKIKEFLNYHPARISWTEGLISDSEKRKQHQFEDGIIAESIYRPFFKQNLYVSRALNERQGQMPKLFPEPFLKNLVICVNAQDGNKNLSAIVTNCIPDLHFNGDAQCFPLYWYEKKEAQQMSLFSSDSPEYVRRDGISDFILERARRQYGKNVAKEDIFYYVYGFLHSPDYRAAFANDLKKSLPRLPLVDEAQDFWVFSNAGRELAELHVNYEEVPPCPGVQVEGDERGLFRVEKMRFPEKGRKDAILFNHWITVANIPEKAYQYVVNGKSAIEWVMERYQVSVHKDSGIENDPNDWAEEAKNPRYVLDLLLSVINLSVQTVEIVERLPKVRFDA